jgi:UDP-2,3-diacylglucosamine pyrophosphatase LpxH
MKERADIDSFIHGHLWFNEAHPIDKAIKVVCCEHSVTPTMVFRKKQ